MTASHHDKQALLNLLAGLNERPLHGESVVIPWLFLGASAAISGLHVQRQPTNSDTSSKVLPQSGTVATRSGSIVGLAFESDDVGWKHRAGRCESRRSRLKAAQSGKPFVALCNENKSTLLEPPGFRRGELAIGCIAAAPQATACPGVTRILPECRDCPCL